MNSLAPNVITDSQLARPALDSQKHDPEIAIRFLKLLHPRGRWVLSAIEIDRKPNAIDTETFGPDTEEQLAAFLRRHAGKNIYYSVAEPIESNVRVKLDREAVARVSYLHVDIDPRAGEDLIAERARILALLKAPTHDIPQPTAVIFSGGGYQALFRLEEPIEIGGDIAKAEEAKLYNKQIEIDLGGDHCHDVTHVMRLPGSINWPDLKKRAKGRTAQQARVEWFDPLGAIPLSRFTKAAITMRAATVLGKSAAIVPGDIKRLGSVHELPDTVRDKTKVLIVQGRDPDEHGPVDRSDVLYHVCCELVRAGVDDATIYSVITDEDFGISASVLDKGAATERYALRQIERAKEAEPLPRIAIESYEPVAVARLYVRERCTDDGLSTMVRWKGSWWRYGGLCYHELDDESLTAQLWTLLDRVDHWVIRGAKRERSLVPLVATRAKVADVREALLSEGLLPRVDGEGPQWLERREGDPDLREVVVCLNGILDLPTRTLHAPTPRLFATSFVAAPWLRDAPRDELVRFLESIWGEAARLGDDDDALGKELGVELISTLQKLLGYLLTPDTRHQKIFLLVGPTRSGKGTIARLIEQLLGSAVATPSLSSLSERFGKQNLIDKSVAIIGDARLGNRTDLDELNTTLLSVSGGDGVPVDRKNLPELTGVRLRTRIVVLSNELPRLRDLTGTLAERFIILPTPITFLNREDTALGERLSSQLAGFFAFAVEGWHALRAAGRFAQPRAGEQRADDLRDHVSPLAAFVRERCEIGPDYSVLVNELHGEWCAWCAENGHHASASTAFGRELRDAVPTLGNKTRQRAADNKKRSYDGIRINPKTRSPL